MTGFICSTPLYEWHGRLFEYNAHYGPPWPVRKDGELYKRVGDKWWDFIQPFLDLPEDEKKEFRVGGGCIRF